MTEQEAPRCVVPDFHHEPDQVELSTILRGLKQDLSLMGCISLGSDGVLRSLTADREVVDAVGLNPTQIAALLCRLGNIEPASDYEGADGTKVPRDAWFAPGKEVGLPPPLSEEYKENSRKMQEQNPELFQRAVERLKQAWN